MESLISLGSNVGDRRDYLEQALHFIKKLPQSRLLRVSSAYLTEPLTIHNVITPPLPPLILRGGRGSYMEVPARGPGRRKEMGHSAYDSPHPYTNAVCMVETKLPPHDLLLRLQSIEDRLGRTRHLHWGDRTIDLDILTCGDLIINTRDLTIPHPEMTKREFVLAPIKEISPSWRHPVVKKTAGELLKLADFPKEGKVISCCGSFS